VPPTAFAVTVTLSPPLAVPPLPVAVAVPLPPAPPVLESPEA
jgi:hypothetical protein